MGRSDKIPSKYKNHILALAVMAFNVLLMGIFFDFYYELNDDILMHDIMSGAYSGIPDGHNMQTLYPLAALIALFYRVSGTVPWYSLFLCLCQFGCFYLIGVRLCSLWDDAKKGDSGKALVGKTAWLIALSLFQWGVWLPHLTTVQYTLTCTMLSATAIFLFVTTEDGLDTRQFVMNNIPAILLVIVAFMLRTEMLLLTTPFICLAGLFRLTGEKRVFVKENLVRYGSVLGMIAAGMILVFAVDYAAYGSSEWKDFRNFFDARTEVYDFCAELIYDDAYGDNLSQLGITPAQRTLLRNYNIILDDAIDTEFLEKMEDYAESIYSPSKDWAAIARTQLWEYFYRTTHTGDMPYNFIVVWAYMAVFALGCLAYWRDRRTKTESMAEARNTHRLAFLWQMILLALMRSAVWMYILMRGRAPNRITHALYLVEFALLAAMAVRMFNDLCKRKRNNRGFLSIVIMCGLTALFIMITAVGLRGNVRNVWSDHEAREQINKGWYEIDAYCREHKDNFYFEDVYSWASFSRRMFPEVDNSLANYDIMGGWICKSPLCREKLRQYDITSAYDSLLNDDSVYLIMSDEQVADQGTEWLVGIYGARGDEVTVERVDVIGENYFVYRIIGQ